MSINYDSPSFHNIPYVSESTETYREGVSFEKERSRNDFFKLERGYVCHLSKHFTEDYFMQIPLMENFVLVPESYFFSLERARTGPSL